MIGKSNLNMEKLHIIILLNYSSFIEAIQIISLNPNHHYDQSLYIRMQHV